MLTKGIDAVTGKGLAEAVPLSNQPQLFLDDHLVAKLKNLHRDMKQPVKHPANPLIRQDFPWERYYLQMYGTVLYEPEFGKFRGWYMAGESNNSGEKYHIFYAESDDGVHWTKPLVGPEPWGSYEKHNRVMAGPHSVCVMKTPWDPDPNRRYKAVAGSLVGFSSDGIRWTLHDWRDAVGKNDTANSCVYWNGEYLAYVRTQEPETGGEVPDPRTGVAWHGSMRGVGLTISRDFVNWTRKVSVLRSDEQDGYPWAQPHALEVTAYGDVLIGLLPMMHIYPDPDNNILGDMDVQLAISRDGRNWRRVADRAVFMPQRKPEPMATRAWDLRFHPSSTMLVKDDLIYIYYGGSTARWGEGNWAIGRLRFQGTTGTAADEAKYSRQFGIGLATLPADRFVSLRPMNWCDEGVLETRPLTFSNCRDLLVNADLSVGRLQVELLDAAGHVLPGFAAEQSHMVPHDPLRHRVIWRTGTAQRALRDAQQQPVSVRFFLRDGDLYAFQVIEKRD